MGGLLVAFAFLSVFFGLLGALGVFSRRWPFLDVTVVY
jgi:hypothetical protein